MMLTGSPSTGVPSAVEVLFPVAAATASRNTSERPSLFSGVFAGAPSAATGAVVGAPAGVYSGASSEGVLTGDSSMPLTSGAGSVKSLGRGLPSASTGAGTGSDPPTETKSSSGSPSFLSAEAGGSAVGAGGAYSMRLEVSSN